MSAARCLKTVPRYMLACVVPDLTNPFYPALVAAVQKVARTSDYEILTIDTEGVEKFERQIVASALQGRFDGLVGVFFNLGIRDLAPLKGAGVPVVRIEASRKGGGELPIDSLYADNEAAAYALTKYVIDQSHRQIALLSADGGPRTVRVRGYERAMREIGASPRVLEASAFTVEDGRRAIAEMLTGVDLPSAVIATNDLMAIGALQAFKEAGLTVPGDVSVAGFDDIMSAALVSPPLTSVTLHQDKLGKRAAERLLERLAGDRIGPGVTEEMPYEIVVRESVSRRRSET